MDNRRIQREMMKLKNEMSDEIWLKMKGDDIRNWFGVIKGPEDTPFQNHYFKIDFRFPENYPIDPPMVKFITPIFHPNIHFKKGDVCLDILKTEWSPAWSMFTVCTAIRLLLRDPVPDSPLNTLAGNLLRLGDKIGYNSMAKMYSNNYGLKNNILKIEDEKK